MSLWARLRDCVDLEIEAGRATVAVDSTIPRWGPGLHKRRKQAKQWHSSPPAFWLLVQLTSCLRLLPPGPPHPQTRRQMKPSLELLLLDILLQQVNNEYSEPDNCVNII